MELFGCLFGGCFRIEYQHVCLVFFLLSVPGGGLFYISPLVDFKASFTPPMLSPTPRSGISPPKISFWNFYLAGLFAVFFVAALFSGFDRTAATVSSADRGRWRRGRYMSGGL